MDRLDYRRTTLPNGARILSRAAPGAYGLRLRLTFQAGATLEEDAVAGLAHLAEHMPFKGTTTYDAPSLARTFARHGAETDAYTDHHETTYIAVLPGSNLRPIMALLAEMLRRPRLAPEDLERERGVVLEELRTYEDDPGALAYQAAIGGLWRGWPQGRPVAGTVGTVGRLGVDDVRDWFARQYGANRLVIGAAGALDHDELVELVSEHFGDLPAVAPASAPAPVVARDGAWVQMLKREGEQVAVSLALPAPAETDPRLPIVEALAMVLGGGDCSRLFGRLRDELGLVYGIDAGLEVGPDASQIIISTECAPESVSRVISEIEGILNRLADEPVAADELADALVALRSRWLLPFDSPLSYADWLVGRELWHGRVESPREVAARFEAVTPGAVHAQAGEIFDRALRHMALVGPLARAWRPVGWRVEPRASRRPEPAARVVG